jgi:hypothetical protein
MHLTFNIYLNSLETRKHSTVVMKPVESNFTFF